MLVALLAAAGGVSCGVESDFTLARDSRMPHWFSTAPARQPDDAIVELVMFTGGTAQMTLYQPGSHTWWSPSGVTGTKRVEIQGSVREHPATQAKRNRWGGLDEDSYPHHWVIWVDNSFEILEFRRMEPLFYVSDDPELRAAAAGTTPDR